MNGQVSVIVPIEIACRKQHLDVCEELLLHTNVNQVSV